MSEDSLLLMHHAPIYHATQTMDRLRLAIRAFNEWWLPLAVGGRVYPLPVAAKTSDANMPWLPALEDITFDTLHGGDAYPVIANSLINFYRYPQDPALNIRRWPGFVVLPVSARALMIEHLTGINALKSELQETLSVIPSSSRTLVVRKTFPGEHILAAYRHIHYAEEDVAHLSFTWLGKSPKNEAVDKSQLLQRLAEDRAISVETGDLGWAAIIDNDIMRVHSVPEALLVERRMHAPAPRLATFMDGQVDNSKYHALMQAPLPFFMAQHATPFVRDLPSWSASEVKSRAGANRYAAVIERLGIFKKI
jgi:hypothetical protein